MVCYYNDTATNEISTYCTLLPDPTLFRSNACSGLHAWRQPDLAPRPAQLGRTADVELAAVAAHDVLHDRQPDAVAVHPLVAAHSALQHHRDLLRRDPVAIVVDRQQQPGPPAGCAVAFAHGQQRSEEHTSELQSLMRISYAVFCLKKKTKHTTNH